MAKAGNTRLYPVPTVHMEQARDSEHICLAVKFLALYWGLGEMSAAEKVDSVNADPHAHHGSVDHYHPYESLPEIHQHALQSMRDMFSAEEGYGLPMNDKTFTRYLRAR